MRLFLDRLYSLSGLLGAAAIVCIFIIVMLQVGANLLNFILNALTSKAYGLLVPSYADFAGFFLVGAVFLACAYTFRQGGHIRVTLIIQNLSPRARQMTESLSLVIAASLAWYFVWFACLLVHESWLYNDKSPGIIAVPLWIPQAVMAFGAVMFAIAVTDTLIECLRGKLIDEDPEAAME